MDDDRHEERPFPAPSRGEDVRVSPELADVAASLLLVLFPERRLMRGRSGHLVTYALEPALAAHELRRLMGRLGELVERPEWRARHALAREVADVEGRRVELLVPVPPARYQGGEALVGPFPDEESAKAWSMGLESGGLAVDTFPAGDAWLCDLFMLGELLQD